jgi:hypothetical protein
MPCLMGRSTDNNMDYSRSPTSSSNLPLVMRMPAFHAQADMAARRYLKRIPLPLSLFFPESLTVHPIVKPEKSGI